MIYLIFYQDGHKVARPVTSRQEFLKLRSSSEQVRNLQLARSGDKEAKKRLVQMNYSCIPNEDGTLKGSKTPSNSVGMYVDFNPMSPEYEQQMKDAQKTILAHKDELGLLMLERRVNKGYHLVFRRHPELSQEENLKWASDLLGIEYDQGAKDLTRVFFSTGATDDDLLFLSDELFADAPLPLPKEAESTPIQKQNTEVASTDSGKDSESTATTEKSLPTTYCSTPYPTFNPRKLPPALEASLKGVSKGMYWPVLAAILPTAAAYADGVEVEYKEGEIHRLGLMSIIVGPQASGKSVCKDVVELWMQQMKADDRPARKMDDEWKTKLKTRKLNEELPNPPKEFIREVNADISKTELLRKLKKTDGHTLYSFCEELGILTNSNNAGSWSDKYAIYRLAFDRGEWGQDFASETSESGIAEVAYNWTMLGTYGAMGPIIKNTENGLASRLIVAEMPDNSFAPLEHNKPKTITDKMLIQEGVRILCSRKGFVDTPRLRRAIHKWVEDKRIEAKAENDHVKDTFRKRSAVIGFRAGVVCHLLAGDEKESKKTVDFALKVAELTLLGQLRRFGKEMLKHVRKNAAISATSYGQSDTTLAKLPTEFTKDDLRRLKGENCPDGTLRSSLSRWTRNGLIEKVDDQKWRKVA